MWGGLSGKRRKYGLYGMVIGIVVSSILLYLSFYIPFLYLLIPVLLVVIFHYTKAWRFSDRAFYGFIVIVISFFLAMGGISSSLTGAPHQTTATFTESYVTYDVHYAYSNNSGNYVFNFSLPSHNVSSNVEFVLRDLFTNVTVTSANGTFTSSGSNYTYSWNAGQLSQHAYVVLITLHVRGNNTTVSKSLEFLGPIMISGAMVVLLLSESLILYYLLITFLFFLAFAFFARAISMSRQRRNKGDQNPPVPSTEQVQENSNTNTGWFRKKQP